MNDLSWSQILKRWVVALRHRFSANQRVGRRAARRGISIEPLEVRALLTANAAILHVAPAWFEVLDPAAVMDQQANVAQPAGGQFWNVQFNEGVARGLASVHDSLLLLGGMPAPFQVVRGLGGIGQIQIQTWGASSNIQQWLSENPAVIGFQQDTVVTVDAVPNDPSWSQLWGLANTGQSGGTVGADIDASASWDRATGSHQVVVAVIDTGIDYDHPDLAANIWTNPGEVAGDGIDNDANGFVDDIHGWDFANNDNDPRDDHGHGTHVAGTIGAVGNNGVGVTGVNWTVSLMAIKFLNAGGYGSNANGILAINYSTMMRDYGINVRVSNNSWAGDAYDATMAAAIAASRDAGILFVAAAGNSASNNDVVAVYPASYGLDNMLSVAATNRSDGLTSFSNYGVNTVDLAAPGLSILSTVLGNQYGLKSGTSMAAPFVTGVAALGVSLFPDAGYQEIRAAIRSGVDPLPGLTNLTSAGGRLNANGTLNALFASAPAIPTLYLAGGYSFEALDLAAGGNAITVIGGSPNETAAIDLGSNAFRFYGASYTGASALYVSSNGLITFGESNSLAANSNLRASPSQPAIAPFWDDLQTGQNSTDRVLAKFEDTDADLISDRLIIEWSKVEHAPSSSSTATFQAILQLNSQGVDGQIVFNYPDVGFGVPAYDRGRSATVGISAGGGSGINRVLVSRDNGDNPLVNSGTAVVFDRFRPTAGFTPIEPSVQPAAIDSVTVTFAKPIDETTFDVADMILTFNDDPVSLVAPVNISPVTGNVYQIEGLAGLTNLEGDYSLNLNLNGVRDTLGHLGVGTVSTSWSMQLPPKTNLRLISATADGLSTMSVTYDVQYAVAPMFELGIVVSTVNTSGTSDVQTASATIGADEDRTIGVHTKTFTIGSGAGKIALPGAGTSEPSGDYFVRLVADPSNLVAENDPAEANSDNWTTFVGVYHIAAGKVLIQGGAGSDTIVTSGTSTVAFNGVSMTYTLSDIAGLTAYTHGGNDSLNAATLSKAVAAWGGDGNDTLTGGSASDSLNGGEGSDSLTGNSGDDFLVGDGGDDTLSGGTGSDTYSFNVDVKLGADVLIEAAGGAGGSDTLDFSASAIQGFTMNLAIATMQLVNPNLDISLSSASAFENIRGGGGRDQLTGNALANILTGGGGDDLLTGAAGNDTYLFDADVNLGSDTIVEVNAGGTDFFDFSSTTSIGVAVNLSQTAPQMVTQNSSLWLTLSDGNVIENVKGGVLGSVLTGNSLSNRLTGGPGNDTLAGGTGNDTYIYDADDSTGTDTLAEFAGGGIDLIDYSATYTQDLTINLTKIGTTQVVAMGLSSLILEGGDFENVTGGLRADILIGNSLANKLVGNWGDDVLTGGDGNDVLEGGTGNNSLNGGAGDDTYVFQADSLAGANVVLEGPDGGIDLLDFSATSSKDLTVDLSLASVQVVNQFLTLTLESGAVIENLIGGSRNDVLSGNALSNVLVGRAGNDTISGRHGNDTLIGGIGNDTLAGGQGDDLYKFAANSALGVDQLVEELGAGMDLLDFSETSTVGVAVNLGLNTQQIVSAYLSLSLSDYAAFENLIGGAGNDTLLGNALDNLLIGGAGGDILLGLAGRDLLLGGTGADSLNGGDGDDLLISGSFEYYSESSRALNAVAVDALAAEWRSASDYLTRIDHLRAGVVGGFRLDSTTVLTDGTPIDTLTGELELDWYWMFGSDIVSDLNIGGTELTN